MSGKWRSSDGPIINNEKDTKQKEMKMKSLLGSFEIILLTKNEQVAKQIQGTANT